MGYINPQEKKSKMVKKKKKKHLKNPACVQRRKQIYWVIVGFDNTLNLNNSANFWSINVIFFATYVAWPEILVLTQFTLLSGRFFLKNAKKSFLLVQ